MKLSFRQQSVVSWLIEHLLGYPLVGIRWAWLKVVGLVSGSGSNDDKL